MLALLPNLSEAVAATDASCAEKNEILQNSSWKSSEDNHMQICFTSCMLPAIGWSQRSYNSHLSVCRVETQTPGVAVPCDGPSHAARPIAVGQCCRAQSWGGLGWSSNGPAYRGLAPRKKARRTLATSQSSSQSTLQPARRCRRGRRQVAPTCLAFWSQR